MTYTYDGDGLRVKKSNGKLYWRSIGIDVLAETDLSGNITAEFIYFAGQRMAARDSAGQDYYIFSDHLGSSRVITNATGAVCGNEDYLPYGGEKITATCWVSYKFATYERDPESGLDYAIFRYYNSRLGRFMSPDPLAGGVGDPQSLNRYAYVLNDPVNLVDPLGLVFCDFTTAVRDAECPRIPSPDPWRFDFGPGDWRDWGGGGGWESGALGLPGGLQLPPINIQDLLFPELGECSSPTAAFLPSCGLTSINGIPIYSFGPSLKGLWNTVECGAEKADKLSVGGLIDSAFGIKKGNPVHDVTNITLGNQFTSLFSAIREARSGDTGEAMSHGLAYLLKADAVPFLAGKAVGLFTVNPLTAEAVEKDLWIKKKIYDGATFALGSLLCLH